MLMGIRQPFRNSTCFYLFCTVNYPKDKQMGLFHLSPLDDQRQNRDIRRIDP